MLLIKHDLSNMSYFIISTLILAALLFIPVSNLIWILSVRRLQRKLSRELNQLELAAQKKRAYFITLLLVIPFALLFNIQLIGLPK